MKSTRIVTPAVVLAVAATALFAVRRSDAFPHERHRGLFPVCIGCHEGIASGDAAAFYPTPESCARCHDGQREERVQWTGPTRTAGNLRFDHVVHADRVAAEADAAIDCGDCHTQPGAPRMAVDPPIPTQCFACHAHQATEHFTDAQCTRCHKPLVETGWSRARISELPVPLSHQREDFLPQVHGQLAMEAGPSCGTCHAREQCAGCHVAFPADGPLDRMPAANARLELPAIAARYPLPETHADRDWERVHGSAASVAACGTCHARESCTNCHRAQAPQPVLQLARARDVAAPGVAVRRMLPESHESAFFATSHGPLASARPESCTSCHERARFCGACHQAREEEALAAQSAPPAQRPRAARGFHPPNFELRHAALAQGRRLDCTACHNTQLFCRDCHQKLGMGSTGRLGPGYHDAEPVWLLRHGQAARQTLETCTSCHTQRDCMQCHSQLGSFRISPHGPDFDARRAQRTNPQICRACHLSDPLGGL